MMTIEDTVHELDHLSGSLDRIADLVHFANRRWWYTENGVRLAQNKGELISLLHSALSEMLEGIRKNTMDSHIPDMSSEEVELANFFICALDYAGAHKLSLGKAFAKKIAYNAKRSDHTYEERSKPHGKKF